MYGQVLGVDVEGVYRGSLCGVVTGLPAGAGPGLLLGVDLEVNHLGHLNRLHHLGDDAVGQEKDGHPVLLRLFKGEHHNIDCFLYRGGGVGQQMVVAVSAALDALKIVALRGLDIAQTGAAAHNVENDAGKLGAAQ